MQQMIQFIIVFTFLLHKTTKKIMHIVHVAQDQHTITAKTVFTTTHPCFSSFSSLYNEDINAMNNTWNIHGIM